MLFLGPEALRPTHWTVQCSLFNEVGEIGGLRRSPSTNIPTKAPENDHIQYKHPWKASFHLLLAGGRPYKAISPHSHPSPFALPSGQLQNHHLIPPLSHRPSNL